MAEDKTRHQEKWVKAVVGLATKIWKGGLLLAWFEHDWRSELMDQNQPMKKGRFECLGKVRQQWFVSSACEGLSSSSLVSLFVFKPLYVHPLHSRRGKRLAERLGNLRRWSWTQRIKFFVSKIQGRSCQKNKNLWKGNSMTWKSKQAKWQIESPPLSSTTKSTWTCVQQSVAKNQSNDTKRKILPNHWSEVDAPLQRFGMKQDSLKKDDAVVWHDMMKCGIDGRAQMEKRTRKEAKWKIRPRQDRSLRNRVVQFTNGAAQGGARTCRSATDSVHCSLWLKDKFPQFRAFSKLSRFRKAQYNDKAVNVFLVMQRLCPTIQKEKESLIESSREPCEEPDCMCSKNCVLWTATCP